MKKRKVNVVLNDTASRNTSLIGAKEFKHAFTNFLLCIL